MSADYFDEGFESKNLRRIKGALSWLTVERALRLALQNCKPSTRKSKGITPNARHLADVLFWEAFGSQSVSIAFRNKEEIAVRAGLWRNEAREALEELREHGVISYDDTAQHKVSVLIQKAVEFWKYPHRVDPKTLATVRAGFRFDTDPHEPALTYQGVVLQGFEPTLRETQHRNAMEMAIKQIESEPEELPPNSTPDFGALRCAVNGTGSSGGDESKEFPPIPVKAEETPSISAPPLSFKETLNKSAFSKQDLQIGISSTNETEVMDACCDLIGKKAWEEGNPNWPTGDGAKWRNRWRNKSGPGQREKMERVFAQVIQDRTDPAFKLKTTWAQHAEDLWQRFR